MKRNPEHLKPPSDKELHGKLKELRALVRDEKWRVVDLDKLQRDFEELEEKFGVDTRDPAELTKLLGIVAGEITPTHYDGSRPPQKAYETQIKGESLFAFCWESTHFGAQMYFKFALTGKDKGRRAYLVSIHETTKK